MAVAIIQRTSTLYQEVVAEMRKVTWPDQAQLKDTTIKILIFVLFVAAVIGLLDVVLQGVLVRGIPSLFAR
ncbi:MAG: preprotein translocase subunit SecE [Gemmatimonadaceae bacterium]